MKKKIFWLVGEKSGDLHASYILKNLPEFYHYGIGGELMQKQGFSPIVEFEKFSIMGFWEIFKQIFFFLKMLKIIKKVLQKDKPDLVVLVDYPGLNLKIAKIAKELSLPVIYYISPKFWAWKEKRIFKLKKYTDLLLSILPFEKKYFEKEKINSIYVGNPISEEISYKLSKEEFAKKFNLDLNKKWIGYFPGSRNSEINRLLPIYQKVIKKFPEYENLVSKIKENENFKNFSQIIENYNYEMMKYCDFLIIKSGTTTLEAAYIGTPFILVFKASLISYLIAKSFVKIKYIGLPNLILDKEIVKEYIQNDANEENIVREIKENLKENSSQYLQMQNSFKEIKEILGKEKVSQKVADIIKNWLEKVK